MKQRQRKRAGHRLRHHPARRRAGARGEHEPGPEAPGRAGRSGHLGVDVIEAGFPVASPGDFEAVQAVARAVEGPTVAALARGQPGRHRPGGRGARRPRRGAASPRLPGHQPHPPSAQAEDVARGRARAGDQQRRVRRGSAARTSSSRPRTPPAPSRTSWPRWWSGSSTPAPPPSTSPTPWATPCPAQFAELIAFLRRTVRGIERGGRSASTATTTWAWPWPTAWPRCRPGRGRWSAP